MTGSSTDKKARTQEAMENAGHEKEHWLLAQAGELGITDDMDTKWQMLDAYCDDRHSEKKLSD